METHKLIIIGSGPSGLTAAIYAARAGLKPLVLAGLTFGGQLMLTTEVENFPGFPQGIQGPELMQNFITQAERFGAQLVYEDVIKADFTRLPTPDAAGNPPATARHERAGGGQGSKPFKLSTGDHEYAAESVIIATGASSIWLGLPSEEKFRGKGVSSCATCDGFFFKGKDIIVVGGGDSAMEEATYLTKFANKVTILNRSENFRASKIMFDKAKGNPKIEFQTNKVVEEFLGDTRLSAVKVKDVKSGLVQEMPIEGAFIAIGHSPNTNIFKDQLEVDDKGYILRKGREQATKPGDHSHFPTATSVPGVFVGGDVHDHHYKQAITASAFGCMAALDAERYLGMDQG